MSKEDIKVVLAKLKKHLRDSEDWDKVNFKGIDIQKLPASKNRGNALAISYNPLGKRKGTYFRSSENFLTFLDTMNKDKNTINTILKLIEKINPKTNTRKKTNGKSLMDL